MCWTPEGRSSRVCVSRQTGCARLSSLVRLESILPHQLLPRPPSLSLLLAVAVTAAAVGSESIAFYLPSLDLSGAAVLVGKGNLFTMLVFFIYTQLDVGLYR